MPLSILALLVQRPIVLRLMHQEFEDTRSMLAERIKLLRRLCRIQQNDFTAVGLSRGTIQNIEGAKSDPSLSTLVAIANVFGITVSQLLDVKADMIQTVQLITPRPD